jgi:hypothetical protein
MDDFDTFKASREKMDPTARKMSEHQWQQAYTAYRNARERVAGGSPSDAMSGGSSGGSSGGKTKKRRRSNTAAAKPSGRQSHRPSSVSELGLLRHKVRGQSAYADLRLIVDILAWVAIALVLFAGIFTLFYYTSVPATLTALLGSLVQVIGIVVARLLVQVLIDIPDISLYRLHQRSVERSQYAVDSES